MLPKNGTAWPPHSRHSEKLAEHSAWYSGDPTALQTFYGPRTGVTARPAQYRGGIVGTLARWWWGVPTPAGEMPSKLHVPLAADICGTSADLLFSEPVGLTSESETMQEFLSELQQANLDATLHEGAEVGAALGGTYLRAVWDSTVSDLPWTEVAHPDGAVPSFRNGRLVEVTLWSELHQHGDTTTVWRLLERHEVGRIEYGLYAGAATNLGSVRPLTEHPVTKDLADVVDGFGGTDTGIERLTVTYIPNMLPNRLHRSSREGRSDLQGIEPILDALDEAYSSWRRDIRHAKSRIYVPDQYLESSEPGQGGSVDLDRELHIPVGGVLGKSSDGLMIEAQQFDIRVQQHMDTCAEWTKRAIEAAGYSTQSLSSDTGGAVTATEVHAKERRSHTTRGKKERYWSAGLREHLETLAEIANAHLGAGIDVQSVKVEFSDGVQESPLNLAQTMQALRNAEAASTHTRVKMLHPDWDEKRVADEVGLILQESGAGEPLPMPDDAGL